MNKEEIINLYSKREFSDFIEYDFEGKIFELLDKEGIEILKNSKLKSDRVAYILNFSPHKKELFKNLDFVDVILSSKISDFYSVFKSIDTEECEYLLNRATELNLDNDFIARLFSFFSVETKLHLLDTNRFNQELIINILNISYDPHVVQKILDTYDIDLTNPRVNAKGLFDKGKIAFLKKYAKDDRNDTDIIIPSTMITKELAERLWNESNVFTYRRIINDAAYSVDVTVLNEYAKKQEEMIINSTLNERLLYPFNEIYESFKIYQEQKYNFINDELNYDRTLEYESYNKFRNLCVETGIRHFDKHIEETLLKGSMEDVYEFICKFSDEKISDCIIDYHFEENYYNIMIDMNELLQYYYDGNIVIDREHLELYEQIINLDYMPIYERINLHNKLKNYNMMAMFYDDMRMARDMVAESIKEYSLSKETIQEHRDEELSQKYGVDVYVMDGEPFFGIVKTGRHRPDAYPTGHSFSLIGDKGLAVFGNPSESGTFLYDSDGLNKEQVVHVFPYDSFTLYKPYHYRTEASMRVNTLMTPEQLTTASYTYNEILILEKGTEETEIDERVPELERIALYCLDKITPRDIEVAKQSGTGIILVNSKKYEQVSRNDFSRNGYSENRYNYFNGTYEREIHEEVRR